MDRLVATNYERAHAEITRLEAEITALRGQVAEAQQQRDAIRMEVQASEFELSELRGKLTEAERRERIEFERATHYRDQWQEAEAKLRAALIREEP